MKPTYTLIELFDKYKECPYCGTDTRLSIWGDRISLSNIANFKSAYIGSCEPLDINGFIDFNFGGADQILMQIYCGCFSLETEFICTNGITPQTVINIVKKTNYLLDQDLHYATLVNYEKQLTIFSCNRSSINGKDDDVFDDAGVERIVELDFTKPEEVLYQLRKIFLLK